MKAPNLHLNLLHASERQWQLMLAKMQNDSLRKDLAAKKAVHGGILQQMAAEREMQAELDQLTMYAHGRRTYGMLFKNLAEAVPEELQLLSLEIPEPPVQNLLPPGAKPGPKVKPLLGPTGTVERVALRIVGRSPKDKPVEALMKSLEGPAFTNELVIAKGVPPNQASPRIRSFNQEDRSSVDGVRQLVFDVEYRCAERRFEK